MIEHEDHLARAKAYLAIAESGDAKREAYKLAAEEIAAYKEETGSTNAEIADALASASRQTVDRILKWRRAGYPEGTTPHTMADGNGLTPTERAALSHTKTTLKNADPDTIKEIVADLPIEQVIRIGNAAEESLTADVEEGTKIHRASQAKRLKKNPLLALMKLGSALSRGRAQIRGVVKAYEEFLALVDDEDVREVGRNDLIALRAGIDLALGEVLEGSYEDALARLIEKEEAK